MIKGQLDDKTILENLNKVKELKEREIEDLVKEAKTILLKALNEPTNSLSQSN